MSWIIFCILLISESIFAVILLKIIKMLLPSSNIRKISKVLIDKLRNFFFFWREKCAKHIFELTFTHISKFYISHRLCSVFLYFHWKILCKIIIYSLSLKNWKIFKRSRWNISSKHNDAKLRSMKLNYTDRLTG